MNLRLLAALLSVVAPVGAGAGCSQSTVDVASGAAVRHDDFTYTVLSAAKKADSDRTLERVSVRLAVRNEALRVGYTYRPQIAFVEDASGRRYQADEALSTPANRIEAGEKETVDLVYRIPVNAGAIKLGYDDGVLMGDVFDGLHYSRVRVALNL